MKHKLLDFVKKETVLVVAGILAILSAFIVPPDLNYFSYIDWRVLGILLSLMLITAGLQKNGVFDVVGKKLLMHTKNTMQLMAILVFLCFFSSMFITNDVALLTFVPFALLILKKCGQEHLLIPVIVLQTIAANLGSMLTPIGNPQNLYLYQLSGFGFGEFVLYMLPYAVVAGILLAAAIIGLGRKKEVIVMDESCFGKTEIVLNHKKIAIYLLLFLCSLLVVAHVLPYGAVLILVLVAVAVLDRDVLWQVDYCLLFTFIAFFIFTGNIGCMEKFQETLEMLVAGRELLAGILASQCISNVPAALLLSGFTGNIKGLLLGVNIGGLGTLIASMASLISYKIYAHNYNRTKGIYFLWFTISNLIFLFILVLLAVIIS